MQEKIASGAAYVSSGGTFLFGTFTANELAAIGGLLIGILTFGVNVYYKRKHYALAVAEYHDRRNKETAESE